MPHFGDGNERLLREARLTLGRMLVEEERLRAERETQDAQRHARDAAELSDALSLAQAQLIAAENAAQVCTRCVSLRAPRGRLLRLLPILGGGAHSGGAHVGRKGYIGGGGR